ncbi:MAG: response regulator [Phycisphaerales bacterium]|nr:response regulator [Phycisphaerales bacterium]
MHRSAPNCTVNAVVIDDDPDHRDLMCQAVRAAFEGERPVETHVYKDAMDALADLPPQGEVVILCDYMLPGGSGIDWLPDFIREDVGPVIMVTSSGNERIAADAFRHGAADYINKQLIINDPDRLRTIINEALRRFRLEHTNRDLARRLKITNVTLEQKNVALAEMTETAHRFVEDVAHEFRTPLTVIKEFAAIMSDGLGGEISPAQHQYLDFIIAASRDLAHLIDDFLDSSKLRAQTLRVDRQAHQVNQLIASAWPMLEVRAKGKYVELTLDVANDLPAVYADAEKVRRTLINLVVNAIKFSDPKSNVTISAKMLEDRAIEIAVTDQGPGMPETEVRSLFQRFRQGGEANTIACKGFGLGLSIVKELVSLNLGAVSVKSAVGKGSTFSFTLPLARQQAIIQAFLDGARDRAAQPRIAAIQLHAASYEKLQAALGDLTGPHDLLLPDPTAHKVVIIGQTKEPEQWIARLKREHERLQQDAAAPWSFEAELLGMWDIEGARQAVPKLVQPSGAAAEPVVVAQGARMKEKGVA